MFFHLYRRRLCIFLFSLLIIFRADGSVFAFDRQVAAALTHYIMAGIYEKQDDIDLTVQEYKKALNADNKNAVIRLALAAVYIKKKQFSSAIEEINRAITLDPEAVEPHALLAVLYFSSDKFPQAQEEYEKALLNAVKLEPKSINVLKNLGILYLRQKKFKSAENVFQDILGISDADYEAHFYLADSLEEQKKRDAAVNELKKALDLKPDYHQALNYLGYLYVEENKNFKEAEKLIKKALEIEPENGAYIDSLGWFYFKQGKIKDAVKELERAAILLEDSVIFDHLGDVYFKIQDFVAARNNWEKSLKLDPLQAGVKQKIEVLNKKK